MKIAEAHLVSSTCYSQGKHYSKEEVPPLPKENSNDYERRTWRNRMHVDKRTGTVVIPPMAFANCIKISAKRLSIKIPGRGQATYTKNFEAGVMVVDSLDLKVKPDDVPGEELFVPSDGKRGGGKRVTKLFPLFEQWEGVVRFHILDDEITEKVFEQVLGNAGSLVGIGRFRPENWGYYGRFDVKSVKWTIVE